MDKPPAIGIDLGTTYSCVGVYEYGAVEIIANDQGHRTTPSYVAFNERGRLIGDPAKNQAAMNPENTVYDAKRLMGRRFNENDVQEDIKHFPFSVLDHNGKPSIEVQYKNEPKQFSPEEISSMVLVKMKEIADAYLGTEVTDAVITVPAYFSDAQRKATKDAGKIAGLNVLRIINEPTAAAIAYGLDKRAQGEKNVLVFDLGGGTFDVSILTIDDGVFDVKTTAGDSHLGGEDFDTRLVGYCVQEFKKKHDKDISNDKKAVRRLRTACESAKRTLSSATHTSVDIPSLHEGIDFSLKINRAKFEELCLDLFQKTLHPVEQALLDARFEKAEIDEIILVGGSTRIPKIQRLLQDYFDGKELNTDINPDEAVAYGAAVQAAILTGVETDVLQDLLLLDVIPLSLGIETVGGVMHTVIKRNSTIPTKETRYAMPDHANQTNVYVTVYEGERPLTKENKKLGEFALNGIKPVPGEEYPIIEILYEIDVDGMLTVSAVDSATGAKNQLTIAQDFGRLSQIEIDRLRKQAEAYRMDDEQELARIQARNYFDNYINHMRSTMNQMRFREQAQPAEQLQFAAKLEEAANWLADATLAPQEEVETKHAELKQFCQPIIQKIYR